MPDYVTKAIERIQHTNPKQRQDSPHFWTLLYYGKRPQMVTDPDESYLLDNKSTKRIQSIFGTFLYYVWSVDPKMLRAINEISRVKSKPKKDTDTKSAMIIDYADIYPNTFIRYHARNMVLHVDSDVTYLTIKEARSWYSRCFYISGCTSPRPVKTSPKIKFPIHTECNTISNVVSSAAEAKTCVTFNNVKTDIGI